MMTQIALGLGYIVAAAIAGAMFVVAGGTLVFLANQLDWYMSAALFRREARLRKQSDIASALAHRLQENGIEPFEPGQWKLRADYKAIRYYSGAKWRYNTPDPAPGPEGDVIDTVPPPEPPAGKEGK